MGTAAESTCVPSTSNLHFCDKKLVTTSTELPLWSTTYRGIGLPSTRPLHLVRGTDDLSFHLVLDLLAAETHQRADLQAALAQRS